MSLHSSRLVKASVLLTLAAATLAFSAPAFADRPTEVPVLDVFTGVNACTGLEETVTVSGTIFRHFHGDQENHHFAHTITTSSGYVGRGTEVGVLHERIFVVNGMLTNDTTGERISVHFLGIHDASGEFRVFRFVSECLGAE